jgi:selenocysteine lyase/cysteine desulfurase
MGAAIRPDTRLVALSHCSNVTGVIQPIREIGALARQAGALFLVDAAQSAGILPLHVYEMGIDLLAAPGHKGLFGVPGTGFLYIAEGVSLTPMLVGGSGTHSTGPEQPLTMPERFESGTLNTPGIAGLKAGVEFIRETGMAAIRARETELTNRLLDGLSGMSGVTIHGPMAAGERVGVVSFTVTGRDPAEIGFLLDRDYDISVRTGLHCAYSAHQTIGTFPAGTVRVSPGFFNADGDPDAFLSALRTILTNLS